MLAVAIMVLGHVAEPRLFDLYADAEVIVVGTVVASDGAIATMKVERWLRGGPGATVRYRSERHFRCDISDAVVGERKLLFLEEGRDGVLAISSAGRGRRDVNDDELRQLEKWLRRAEEATTFQVETETCPRCTVDGFSPVLVPYDKPARIFLDAQLQPYALNEYPIGECRTRIELTKCTSDDPAACEPAGPPMVRELRCASVDRARTETTAALPATQLHCSARDNHAYRGCLVIPREGYDVTPRTGETLRCFFDADSKLECWRFPSGT